MTYEIFDAAELLEQELHKLDCDYLTITNQDANFVVFVARGKVAKEFFRHHPNNAAITFTNNTHHGVIGYKL